MFYFQLYALLSVLLITVLAFNVSRVRIRERIANGDGHVDLKKAIRAHMNALEHCLPFGLLVLALAQMNPLAPWLSILVLAFIVARVLHAVSMVGAQLRLRQASAGVTYLLELAGCVILACELLALP